jgi:hypothetical protein
VGRWRSGRPAVLRRTPHRPRWRGTGRPFSGEVLAGPSARVSARWPRHISRHLLPPRSTETSACHNCHKSRPPPPPTAPRRPALWRQPTPFSQPENRGPTPLGGICQRFSAENCRRRRGGNGTPDAEKTSDENGQELNGGVVLGLLSRAHPPRQNRIGRENPRVARHTGVKAKCRTGEPGGQACVTQ